MAGEWLKFECSLPDKPETLAITVAMGWDDPDLAVGKLMRLFRWFDQHTIDGNAAGVTPALLDRLIGATGFVQAVADVGWLEIGNGFLALQNFDRHNGATAKSRALTAKRVAKSRSNAEANGGGNAATVTEALAREEKKREEVIPPKPPKGGRAPISLTAWLTVLKASGEKPVPEDDPVFDYAKEVGISHDFLRLAWLEFRHRYSQPEAKRYRDWRAVFRKAVRGNWLKLWWLEPASNAYALTTAGQQAARAHQEKTA